MGLKSILNNLAACQGCGGSLRQLSLPPADTAATSSSTNPRQLDPILLEHYEPLQKLGTGSVLCIGWHRTTWKPCVHHLVLHTQVAQTWLMQNKKDKGLYAVKLVPRPLPQFITESLLREITVGDCAGKRKLLSATFHCCCLKNNNKTTAFPLQPHRSKVNLHMGILALSMPLKCSSHQHTLPLCWSTAQRAPCCNTWRAV